MTEEHFCEQIPVAVVAQIASDPAWDPAWAVGAVSAFAFAFASASASAVAVAGEVDSLPALHNP